MKNIKTYTEFITEDIDLTPEQMDKLHSEGSVEVDGVKINYKEPKNPVPQDENIQEVTVGNEKPK